MFTHSQYITYLSYLNNQYELEKSNLFDLDNPDKPSYVQHQFIMLGSESLIKIL